MPDNKSVSNVLSSLTFGTDYNQVSTWDSASGTWKHWVNDSDFNDFTEFQYGKTYEIYNNSGVNKSLSVTGTTNGADLTHNIVSGDNFISPAVKTATNISTVLSSLTLNTHYSDVKRFNATSQTWESYANSDFTQFEPGRGYNIIGLTTASFSYGKTETVTTMVYDSTGQRVKKTAGGTTTTYLGKDYDVTGATSTKYIFLGDRRLATKDSGGTLQFIHDDHISSSNVVTDASGNQAGLFEYDPYGATVTHTGSADPKHKFTGQESDDSTKLYNYGARYYDPQLGRFITPDWYIQDDADPQYLNPYAYARNNPINFTDPTGNFAFFAALISFFVAHATQFAVASIILTAGSLIARAAGAEQLSKILGIAAIVTAAASIVGTVAGGAQAANTGSGFAQQKTAEAYQQMAKVGIDDTSFSYAYWDPNILTNLPPPPPPSSLQFVDPGMTMGTYGPASTAGVTAAPAVPLTPPVPAVSVPGPAVVGAASAAGGSCGYVPVVIGTSLGNAVNIKTFGSSVHVGNSPGQASGPTASYMGSSGGAKGEKGWAGKPSGTGNPYKGMSPHPTKPGRVKTRDQHGREKEIAKPEGFDEAWEKKHGNRK